MVKIYTKTGDSGMTSLGFSKRVAKNDERIGFIGEMDELISLVGVVLSFGVSESIEAQLHELQRMMYVALAYISECSDFDSHASVVFLEEWIDGHEKSLPPLKNFIAPGGCSAAAHLYYARTLARRAERSLVSLKKQEVRLEVLVPFLNRISDYLFVAARAVNASSGIEEKKLTLHE